MLKTYSKHLKAFTAASDSLRFLESPGDSIMVQPVVQPVGNWAADIKVMIPETAILLRVQDLQQSLKWPGSGRFHQGQRWYWGFTSPTCKKVGEKMKRCSNQRRRQQIFDNSESSQLKKDLHAYLDLTVARVGFQDMFVRILQDNCNQVYNTLQYVFFAHRFARTQWRW